MTTFLQSLVHFAYTLSLLAVLVFVALNITIPVSLQWPTYCTKACRIGTPMREQCESFCQLHEDTYTRVRAFTGFGATHMQRLLEKNNPVLTQLISQPPGWFFALNVLMTISAAISTLFWASTILSDALAHKLRRVTGTASTISGAILAAYTMLVLCSGVRDIADLYRLSTLYTDKERIVLGLILSYPLLQNIVLWTIPADSAKQA